MVRAPLAATVIQVTVVMGGDEDDEGPDGSSDPCWVGSEELGFRGAEAEEKEVESSPVGRGSLSHHPRVHIMRGGHEVATDEDEPDTGTGKHALGEASHSMLRHFAISCEEDEPEIDLFTSPNL